MSALLTGDFIDPVEITLPKGDKPSFVLAKQQTGDGYASATIIKDGGDDPDVTHLAAISVSVKHLENPSGIRFVAGPGVGTVTKAGLPIGVGEPAVNPVPRKLMTEVVEQICEEYDCPADIEITISVEDGAEIAKQTWNPRLGITGGISILGTTGVVHPFSCSAWIHSIHRGVDVCRANNIKHALAATGSTSETAAAALYDFPQEALLDMGDFAGGLLKYLRNHPIERVTIGGGFAKLSKLANGYMDLHSGRSQVDLNWLADRAIEAGLPDDQHSRIARANTALEALEIASSAGIDLAMPVAIRARDTATRILREAPVSIEIIVVSRSGEILAKTGFK